MVLSNISDLSRKRPSSPIADSPAKKPKLEQSAQEMQSVPVWQQPPRPDAVPSATSAPNDSIPSASKFFCPQCQMVFASHRAWMMHLPESHPYGPQPVPQAVPSSMDKY